MAENNQLSDTTNSNSTDTSSTDASSVVIGNHENAVVPHKISNHDKLVQTMVMVDGEWININDTNDQANMKEDMQKVNNKVVEAQKGIVEAKNAADSAVNYADSAVSASKVNSDAILAQSSATNEAKAAADDAMSRADSAWDVATGAKEAVTDFDPLLKSAQSDASNALTQIADTASALSDAKTAFNSDVAEAKELANTAQTTANSAVKSASSVADDLATVASQAKANANGITKVTSDVGSLQTTVADNSGNISKIQETAAQIQQAVSDNTGNITIAKQTANSAVAVASDASSNATVASQTASQASITANNASGQAASAVLTANGAMTTASNAESNATVAIQTANGASLTATNAQGDATIAKQTASEATVQASNAESDFAQLSIRAGQIEANVANNSGAIASVQQTADGLTTTVADIKANGGGVNLVQNTSTDIVIDATSSGANNWTFATIFLDEQPKQGDLITISAEGTLTGTGTLDEYQVILYDRNATNPRSQAKYLKAGQRDSVTLSLDNLDGSGDTVLLIYAGKAGETIGKKNVVHHLMLEEGTVAHDWSPSPDDLQTQFTQTKESIDGITTTINDPKTGLNATYQTAQSNASTITNVQGDVTQLQTTAAGLTSRVGGLESKTDTQETTIEQNKNAIALKADQTEVDTVKGTASQNSSRLDTMANEIQSKVTSTDVNNIVDGKGYATTSTVQSLITQNAGTINENITNLTTELKNNNGGGVNLVSGTTEDIVVDDTANTGTQGYCSYTVPINADLKVGDKITISVENVTMTGKGDLSKWGATLYSNDISEQRADNHEVNAGKNAQVTITVTSMNDPNKQTALLIYSGRVGDTEGKKAVFHHLKVERGSIATPWSPAPSDNATVTQIQQVTASVDGLQSTVTNKADQSQLTQLSNLVQSKVSSNDFNSKITQLTNNINLRVTKGDLISQLNLEAGGDGLIQVANGKGKLYLDADSVVFSNKAFIPSAAITDIDADKITTGILNSIAINNGDGAFTVNSSGDVVANSIKVRNGNFYQGDIFGANIYAIMRDKDQRAFSSLDDVDEAQDNWFKINGDILEWHRTPDEYASIGPSLSYVKDNHSPDDHDYTGTTLGLTIVGTKGITLSTGDQAEYAEDDPKVGTYKDPIKNIQNLSWANETRLEIGQDHIQTYLGNGDNISNGSYFSIQKDNYLTVNIGTGDRGDEFQSTTAGRQGFHSFGTGVIYFDRLDHGPTHDSLNNFAVFGNLNVTQGQKNSLVKTSQGWTAVHAYETAEYYFGDIGENNTGANGKVIVGLDQLFAQTINTDMQYQVFLTPYSNAHVWIDKRYSNRFVVCSDQPNAEFGWELKGHRKGYEHSRLTNFSQSMK